MLLCGCAGGEPRGAAADTAQDDDGEVWEAEPEARDAEPTARADASAGRDDAGVVEPGETDSGKSATTGPDAGDEPIAPMSEYCGDGIRDPVLEECDDGSGEGKDDSCTPACRVRTLDRALGALLPQTAEQTLGTGAHSAAGSAEGFAVVYLEHRAVWLQLFDSLGRVNGDPIEVSAGAEPTLEANPVVAAIPGGKYAVAWTDGKSGTPDVLLRLIDGESRALNAARPAHKSASSLQHEPDLIWVDGALWVAWTDLLDLKIRPFDELLEPLEPEQNLAATGAIEYGAALTAWDDTWAAAYHSNDEGVHNIEVVAGTARWSIQGGLEASEEKPALVTLADQTLILISRAVVAGPESDPALRLVAAGLDPLLPTLTNPVPLAFASQMAENDSAGSARRPSVASVPDEIYLAWEQGYGQDTSDVLWGSVEWDPVSSELFEGPPRVYVTPARETGSTGFRRNPRVTFVPSPTGGALLTVWESTQERGGVRISLEYRPWPFVFLDDETE